MTQPAGRFSGGIEVPSVASLKDEEGDPLDIIGAADMQAALDAELADIDGGAPDTSYTDTIDGGAP